MKKNPELGNARSPVVATEAVHKAYLAITNQRGLHARTAARFVKLAKQFDVEISVSKDGQTVSDFSITGLLNLVALSGDKIKVDTSGSQAKEAFDAISNRIEQNFGGSNY